MRRQLPEEHLVQWSGDMAYPKTAPSQPAMTPIYPRTMPRQETAAVPGERWREAKVRREEPEEHEDLWSSSVVEPETVVCGGSSLPGARSNAPLSSARSRDSNRDTQTDDTEQSGEFSLARMMGAMQAPRVAIQDYPGDPMSYHQFVREFEENMEKLLPDSGARLARLLQLCKGEAHRAIKGCILMRPDEGYSEARRILR